MRILLDTHIYLWWLRDDSKLRLVERETISGPSAIVYISAATIWEIAIKTSLGKLDVDGDPVEEILENGFVELPITARHARLAGMLPRHHDDPFDRMLVAQSKLENLPLMSRDKSFEDYSVSLFRAKD